MSKTFVATFMAALLSVGSAFAQEPDRPAKPAPRPAPAPSPTASSSPAQAPAPAPTPPEAAQPARDPSQAVNVKLDLTITDQAGAGEPSRKVITLIVADGQNGYIRSKGNVWITEEKRYYVTINVDARPVILRDGLVRVDLGLEYQPTPPDAGSPTAVTANATNLNQRIGVILHEGKPLVVSQAVDPASDRRISVELKATILK
jgi:hypothetical protein